MPGRVCVLEQQTCVHAYVTKARCSVRLVQRSNTLWHAMNTITSYDIDIDTCAVYNTCCVWYKMCTCKKRLTQHIKQHSYKGVSKCCLWYNTCNCKKGAHPTHGTTPDFDHSNQVWYPGVIPQSIYPTTEHNTWNNTAIRIFFCCCRRTGDGTILTFVSLRMV